MVKINKNVILVDCFDTVIHRTEHPYTILKRWAFCIARLYTQFQYDEILNDRFSIIRDSSKNISLSGIYFVYEEMARKYISQNRLSEEERAAFVNDLKYFELMCESSAHYIDKKAVKILRENKDKKIFCITDYHLFSEDIIFLLKRLGIDELFDGVYSSASYGASKYDGSLYEKVLSNIPAAGKDCIMIGDNREVDIVNARRHGIKGLFLPHIIHKTLLRLKNKFSITRQSTISKTVKKIWKTSNAYEEYIVLFFVFSQRLYNAARKEGVNKIVFLSREGYFLKICFEIYQRFCIPVSERLKTDYLICSRRAIQSVQPDKCKPEQYARISVMNYFRAIGFTKEEVYQMSIPFDVERVIDHFPDSSEADFIRTNNIVQKTVQEHIAMNQSAFQKYVESKIDGNILCLVDVGWHGSVQQGIEQLFDNIKTIGYYIGIYGDLSNPPYNIERNGLIFHKSSDKGITPYFYIFRSNIQIYEQLLSAPHGGGDSYRFDVFGNPVAILDWDEKEKKLYKETIEDVQKHMCHLMESLCCQSFKGCNDDEVTKELAYMVLRSCLIQSDSRLQFMKKLNEGFVWNFGQQTTGLKFDRKVNVGIKDIFLRPDAYVRYFAKMGIVLEKKKIGWARYPINRIFFWYVKLVLSLRELRHKI